MKKIIALCLTLSMGVPSIVTAQNLNEKLDHHFNSHLTQNPEQPVANILVYLENENKNFVYNKGFGQISISKTTPVQKDSPFKTASVTKMLTSTLILQLVEAGKLSLNDTGASLIGDIDFIEFDKLQIINGKNYGREITIEQMLNHTSGLADVFTDTVEEFMGILLENPQKQWTPEDLFKFYYDYNLNNRAHFKPGKDFYYSDVNYFLLGLIIEKTTGLRLAEAYRSYILEPAGMNNTYLEYHEASTNQLAMPSAYIGNMEIDKNISTSFDWAGGGLVSTTYDLNLFMKALFSHKLIKDSILLEKMITDSKNRYGYGLFLYNFSGVRFYGHSGYWGSDVFYSPEEKITMVVSVNQTELPFSHKEFIRGFYDLIK